MCVYVSLEYSQILKGNRRMTEGDQSSHWLRDAGTVPMCICLHLLLNYSQAEPRHQEANSQAERYIYCGLPMGVEVKGPNALD